MHCLHQGIWYKQNTFQMGFTQHLYVVFQCFGTIVALEIIKFILIYKNWSALYLLSALTFKNVSRNVNYIKNPFSKKEQVSVIK